MATVLCVEDNPGVAYLRGRVLREAGFEVVTAATVAEAAARLAGSALLPDLVLSDVVLPDVPGTELARRIKRDARTRLVPVLLVSAIMREPEEVAVGLEAADGYVVEPVEPVVLVSHIRALLRGAATQRDLNQALLEKERQSALLEKLIAHLPVGVLALEDSPARVTVFNEEAGGILGFSVPPGSEFRRPEGAGAIRPDGSVCPEEDSVEIRALRRGEVIRGEELIYRRPDGSICLLSVNAGAISDGSGKITGAVVSYEDVTSKSIAEQAVHENARRLKALVESNVMGVVTATRDRVTDANDNYLNIVGYTRDEMRAGKLNWRDITAPEHVHLDMRAIEELTKHGHCTPYEKDYVRRDGTRVAVLLGAAVIHTVPELEWICFVADLSAQKRLERELVAANAALRKSNEDLQRFAYAVSHDLQEPLRAIAGFTGILARRNQGKLAEGSETLISDVLGGVARMRALIEDILRYSRVVYRDEAPLEPTPLDGVFMEAMHNLQAAAQTSGAEVTRGPLPVVTSDGRLLVQVFQNLIGNAIKYRSKEPPRVHVSAEQREGQWVVSVRDNGIGLDMAYADRIFRVFQRLHSRDEYPGTGIGLAICKRVVERLGGQIWVESQPGAGSTFYFTLPDSK